TTTTGYDIGGRVTREVDAEGLVSCRDHDFMGRLTGVLQPGDSVPTTITYQQGGVVSPIDGSTLTSELVTVTSPLGNFERRYIDGMGRAHIVESPNAISVTHYDAFGRMIREDERASSSPMQPLRVRAYDYTPGSPRLWRSTDWIEPTDETTCRQSPTSCPSEVLERTYTAAGRIASLIDGNQQTTSYAYLGDGFSLLSSVSLQDVSTHTFVYDPTFPIVEQLHEGDAQPIVSTYTRQRHLRVEQITKARPTVSSDTESDVFTHDALGRVERAERLENGVVQSTIQTTWDPLGHIGSRTVDVLGHSMQVGLTHRDNGQLESVTYPSGNVANYAYAGSSGRLSQVLLTHDTNPAVNQVLYDVPLGYDDDGRVRQVDRVAPASVLNSGKARLVGSSAAARCRRGGDDDEGDGGDGGDVGPRGRAREDRALATDAPFVPVADARRAVGRGGGVV
ncbi:MAG: hypothetical protein AAF602_12825, partial [Myxococcota bacterium]